MGLGMGALLRRVKRICSVALKGFFPSDSYLSTSFKIVPCHGMPKASCSNVMWLLTRRWVEALMIALRMMTV